MFSKRVINIAAKGPWLSLVSVGHTLKIFNWATLLKSKKTVLKKAQKSNFSRTHLVSEAGSNCDFGILKTAHMYIYTYECKIALPYIFQNQALKRESHATHCLNTKKA